jgi:hypothetical protein
MGPVLRLARRGLRVIVAIATMGSPSTGLAPSHKMPRGRGFLSLRTSLPADERDAATVF